MRIFLLTLAAVTLSAQAPQRKGPPMNLADLVKPLAESGFTPLFDGSSLKGWDGDPAIWRAETGSIVGETKPDTVMKHNQFLIWRGGRPADFELKLEYKLTGNNSGVQVRSEELPDLKWAMKGYQADIDGRQMFTGQFYEERGRGFLALRGQVSYIAAGQKPGLVARTGTDEELKGLLKSEDWNEFHVIARGNTLVQIINGRVTSVVIDDDKPNRKMDGLIGFQVHMGPPMKVEFRNVRLKTY